VGVSGVRAPRPSGVLGPLGVRGPPLGGVRGPGPSGVLAPLIAIGGVLGPVVGFGPLFQLLRLTSSLEVIGLPGLTNPGSKSSGLTGLPPSKV
jgi:hypothetical protein